MTVFRSRLRPEAGDYEATAAAMHDAARAMPGFVDAKTFTAEDGERVTVVTFADAAALQAWRDHDGHRQAQSRGRSEFYRWYTIQTGTCERVIRWARP